MQKIMNCLWFDRQAEEAAKFYTGIFKNSKILKVSRYGEASACASGLPVGTVLTVLFQIEGQGFLALNGGPVYQFTPAISLMVSCKTQAEIDRLWSKLSADPAHEQCGWMKDKYGVSWQIVPQSLLKMTTDKNTDRSNRVMQALMQMKKLDLPTLERAYKGK